MGEAAVKREARALARKTAMQLERESFYCALAVGKLGEVASVLARDKGGTRIIKSVYHKIGRPARDRLLHFDEFSDLEGVLLEIWFWKLRARVPFERKKLLYNKPDQRINSTFEKLVKLN